MATEKAKPAKKETVKKEPAGNMKLWDQVCKTDPSSTKGFKGKGGFSGTAVCAQSQRRRATEVFGIYGLGWGVQEESYETILLDPADPHTGRLIYKATFVFNYEGKEGRFPIVSEIEMYTYSQKWKSWAVNNDVYKKVRTDALTKGLSELGFNSDIFEGKYDDSKYVNAMREEFSDKNPEPKPQPNPKPAAQSNSRPAEKEAKPAPAETKSPDQSLPKEKTAEPPADPKDSGQGSDSRGTGEGDLPAYDENDFDSMFAAARGIVNQPAAHNLNPQHIPNIMGLVMKYKKTSDLEEMRQFMGSFKLYLSQDPAGREETNKLFEKRKKA